MEKLKAWMQAEKLRQREAARRLGVSETVLSKILTGKRKPSLTQAVAFNNITSGAVPPSAWVEGSPD